MPRINWLHAWDRLYTAITKTDRTSFGKNQLVELMNDIEKEVVRDAEMED